MPVVAWARRTCMWASMALLSWCMCAPTTAHAATFAWAVEAGLDFSFLKNGLRLDRKPPLFRRDMIGAQLSLSAIGVLHINNTIEINASFDAGELFFGQRTRSGQTDMVVWLNQMRLNWNETELQEFREAEEECRLRAASQGVPGTDCVFYSAALAENLLMRELYVRISLGKKQKWHFLDVGFRGKAIGRGYLFDDYALGLFWEADLRKREGKAKLPLRIRLDLFLSDASFTPEGKQSPVVNASISYLPRKGASLTFFTTYMYDGDRLAAKAILPMWQDLVATRINQRMGQQQSAGTQYFCRNSLSDDEYAALDTIAIDGSSTLLDTYDSNCDILPKSSGHHLWFGIEGKGTFGKLLLEGVAMLYVAGYQIDVPAILLSTLEVLEDSPRRSGVLGLGMMAEIKATIQWNRRFSTGLFFMTMSGDHFEPDRGQYYTFAAITPQARYTELFFNGGVNAYSYRQGLGISTVAGKGVLAVGLMLDYKAEAGVQMKLNASALWSVVPSTFSTLEVTSSGQFYGAEFNFIGGYKLTDWCRLAVKSDLLFPGNFFASVEPPPVVFRMQAGFVFSLDG